MTNNDIEDVLKNGTTSRYVPCINKEGKKFSAKLILDKSKRSFNYEYENNKK